MLVLLCVIIQWMSSMCGTCEQGFRFFLHFHFLKKHILFEVPQTFLSKGFQLLVKTFIFILGELNHCPHSVEGRNKVVHCWQLHWPLEPVCESLNTLSKSLAVLSNQLLRVGISLPEHSRVWQVRTHQRYHLCFIDRNLFTGFVQERFVSIENLVIAAGIRGM